MHITSQQQAFEELCMRLPEWVIFVENRLMKYNVGQQAHEKVASGIFWLDGENYLWWHVAALNWDDLVSQAHAAAITKSKVLGLNNPGEK